jgi:hypothetical protein
MDNACLRCANWHYQLATREGGIYIDGFRIQIASAPVLPWKVFLCPACSCVRYKLFEINGRWACYRCHHLTHASRHRHRTIPHYHRPMRLRRKIGADPRPFAPLPERPRRHTRFHRIAAEIRVLEFGLVGHLGEINRVLERRIRKLK